MVVTALYLKARRSGASVKVGPEWVKVARSRDTGLSQDASREGCEVRLVKGKLQGRAKTRVFVQRHAQSVADEAFRFQDGQEFDMGLGDTLFITKRTDACALVLQVRLGQVPRPAVASLWPHHPGWLQRRQRQALESLLVAYVSSYQSGS